MANKKLSTTNPNVIPELLKSKSREDLVNIIWEMVDKYPDLIHTLQTPIASKAGNLLNLSQYQKRIDLAFKAHNMHDIANALTLIVESAQKLVEVGNWKDGGRLYQILLEDSINSYDDMMMQIDYNGNIACVIQEMVEGLSHCLLKNDDQEMRMLWLNTLLDGELKDIELGGMDFAAGAWDGMVAAANDDDWDWIETIIRGHIQVTKEDSWAKEALVGLLSDRSERMENEEGVTTIIEELGSPKQKVFLWASQGKWDEAIGLAKQKFANKPGLVFEFADEILEANLPERALAYVLNENGTSDRRKSEWLEKYYIQHGTTTEAIEWILKGFEESPHLERYLGLKTMHPKKGEWKTLQTKLFAILETKKRFDIWIDIMLEENDLDQAIKLLAKLSHYQRSSQQLKIAKVAEQKKPEAAIVIYQTVVTNYISEKTRSAYQRSIRYLEIIRSLYESTNQQSVWTAYITTLKATYSNLPALQEELTKAKL